MRLVTGYKRGVCCGFIRIRLGFFLPRFLQLLASSLVCEECQACSGNEIDLIAFKINRARLACCDISKTQFHVSEPRFPCCFPHRLAPALGHLFPVKQLVLPEKTQSLAQCKQSMRLVVPTGQVGEYARRAHIPVENLALTFTA